MFIHIERYVFTTIAFNLQVDKKIDIFVMEKLFFPININNTHWVLAVAFIQSKRIQFFDSMVGSCNQRKFLKSGLLRWLSDESIVKGEE